MATSVFQNVRAALVALIGAPSNVVVSQYPPYGNEWTVEDRIWVAGIRASQAKLSMGGSSGARTEDLEIDVVIYAPRFGGSQDEWAEAEVRAEAILAVIEAAVRNDDTIGGSVLDADVAEIESRIDMSHEGGPVGFIELTITATANL
jgi:hypothetical protein